MILKKSLQMVPLLLGITSGIYYKGTDLEFNEKDIKNNLTNIDFDVASYNKKINSLIYNDAYMKNRIRTYVENWNKETLILSDINAIIQNNNFQQILSIGNKAVPYILAELKEKPSTLVWVMNLIIGKKISNNNLSIVDASKAWVKWGIQKNLIEA